MSNDNSVFVTGNVTRAPETRFGAVSQTAVTKFGIAVNKSKKQPDGTYEDQAHFFDVTCFGGLADNVSECINKGDRVTITGELEYSTWDDKETGDKRSKVAIVANDVAVSLRWATATVTKNAKGSGGGSSTSVPAAEDDEFWK